MRTERKSDETSTEELVNYMPAMPNVSEEPNYLVQFVDGLLRRNR